MKCVVVRIIFIITAVLLCALLVKTQERSVIVGRQLINVNSKIAIMEKSIQEAMKAMHAMVKSDVKGMSESVDKSAGDVKNLQGDFADMQKVMQGYLKLTHEAIEDISNTLLYSEDSVVNSFARKMDSLENATIGLQQATRQLSLQLSTSTAIASKKIEDLKVSASKITQDTAIITITAEDYNGSYEGCTVKVKGLHGTKRDAIIQPICYQKNAQYQI